MLLKDLFCQHGRLDSSCLNREYIYTKRTYLQGDIHPGDIHPAGTQRRTNAAPTPMQRDDIASTSKRRHPNAARRQGIHNWIVRSG